MRINRIKIDRYGELKDIDLTFDSGLQAIYGDNESGKTLILDFLIKKLAGKDVYYDKSIHRVTEEPEGFIIIADGGKEKKLEIGEILPDFLQITADEIRNIFLIRDSDLKFQKESNFFESITNKLTGINTADLAKISEKIHEIGRLTKKKKELADDKKHNRISSKLGIAKTLEEKILAYQVNAASEGLNELEGLLYDKIEQLDKNQKTIIDLKKAKKKNEFEKMDGIIENSRYLIENINNLPEKKELDKISIKIDQLNETSPKRDQFHMIQKFTKWSLWPFVIIATLLWFLWFFLNIPKLGIASPIILSIFSLAYFIIWTYTYFRLKDQRKKEIEIFSDAKKIGLSYKSIKNLTKNLTNLISKHEGISTNLIGNIGVLRNYFSIESNNEEKVLANSSKLLEEFKPTIDFNIKIKYTEEKITKEEEKNEKIREEIENLKENLKNHQQTLQEFSNEAYSLNFDFIINEELDIVIENLGSLDLLKPKLQRYINNVEQNAENCRQALSIFEEIELEEKGKIRDLFIKKNQTSQIFKEFTKGKYVNVQYDQIKENIIVEKSNGQLITADKLSKGAFDQLYLAIRLDFAQRILKKKKGFFIMDDAFLSADHKRFEEGISILKMLTDKGWHIIYFTAKITDSNHIEKVSGKKTIVLDPLE